MSPAAIANVALSPETSLGPESAIGNPICAHRTATAGRTDNRMPEDTIVYVIQDNHGSILATLDETEAQIISTEAFGHQRIEHMTLSELQQRDPRALVRARCQYFLVSDLLGTCAAETTM